MKTHSARWYQNSPNSWILKETVKNGSAVLASVREINNGRHTWHANNIHGVENSRYAAQRSVRRVLREQENT